MRIILHRSSLVFLLCVSLSLSSLAPGQAQQRNRNGNRAAAKKVRLVLGIVIDQFRADYLNRFEDQFVEGGFKRLVRDGANFANARYIHTPTYTACGHATFMSGATPANSGIIGNSWYDRPSGKVVTSVSDENVKLLGGRAGAGMSPHRLLGTTVGDELKLASIGKSKVIGISSKDRSAILPVGKHPDGAYWFDNSTGNFVSSTYYFNDLPEWVKTFNRDQHCSKYFGQKWERLLPEASYDRSAPDDAPYEKSAYGKQFPYTLNGGESKPGPKFYSQFDASPYGNEQLVRLAKAAIEAEQIGADDYTDLLTISFSANDLVGHAFGPYSREVHDITLRTDRTIADLLAYLDQKIGLDRVIVTLTADHGVAPVPEMVKPMGYGGRIESQALTEAVQSKLGAQFGEEKWVLNSINGNIYLDETIAERKKLTLEEVERAAAEAVLKVPGIADCFTRSQILSGRLPDTLIAKSVARGFHHARNGNLVIVPQPFYFIGEGVTTTHGTPYGYDTHVPVLFFGAGVAAGPQYSPASPADIAPTLAALLKVTAPSNSVGRVLSEAFKVTQ
jgi:predicted AlkP superfamily pyrophosphatase or phosphodiesterase